MSLPTWLRKVQLELEESTEWKNVLKVVYEQSMEKLAENNLSSFAELNAAERSMVLSQVEEEISDESTYHNFVLRLTNVMDEGLNKVVQESFYSVGNDKTKQEIMMNKAGEGSSALMENLPMEQKSVLRTMLNAQLPEALRYRVWKMHLKDSQSRKEYMDMLNRNKLHVISCMDMEITQKCQTLLESKFKNVVDAGCTQRMVLIDFKSALSYYHVIRPDALKDMENGFYRLMIPILIVFGKFELQIPMLVEAYSALLAMERPRLRIGANDPIGGDIIQRLQELDAELYGFMQAIYMQENPNATKSRAETEMAQLCSAYIEYLFVGIATPETCLFIWDQLFMAGFENILVEFPVAFILLLRDNIGSCETFQEVQTVLDCQSETISIPDLQKHLAQHVIKSLKLKLGIENSITFHPEIVINNIPGEETHLMEDEVESVESEAVEEVVPELPAEAKTIYPAIDSNLASDVMDAISNDKENIGCARVGNARRKRKKKTVSAVVAGSPQQLHPIAIGSTTIHWPLFFPLFDQLMDTVDRIIACTTNEAAIAKLLKKHPMEALKTKIAGQVLVQAEHLPKDRSALEPIFQRSLSDLSSRKSKNTITIRAIFPDQSQAYAAVDLAFRRQGQFKISDKNLKLVAKELAAHSSFSGDANALPPAMKAVLSGVQAYSKAMNYVFRDDKHKSITSKAQSTLEVMQDMYDTSQQNVYQRKYTDEELKKLTKDEKEEYDLNYPKFLKMYNNLHEQYVKNTK